MRELLRGLLELALPPTCAACGADAPRALCGTCAVPLPWIPLDRCTRCQQAAPQSAESRCAACARQRSPLAACVAALHFAGAVERWIHRFKYPAPGWAGLDPGAVAVAQQFAKEAAARAPGRPELLVPVPLHCRRLRARGFNPACLLARAISHVLRVPVDPMALARVRDTPSQTGLDRRERQRNLRGAFRARRQPPACVWLVDDVVTTSSTLEEAARALRRAGARTVVGVCAARTPEAS